ncbi:hypothetical protein GCM10009608_79700 [Pseudonocardia alaniniphila]
MQPLLVVHVELGGFGENDEIDVRRHSLGVPSPRTAQPDRSDIGSVHRPAGYPGEHAVDFGPPFVRDVHVVTVERVRGRGSTLSWSRDHHQLE